MRTEGCPAVSAEYSVDHHIVEFAAGQVIVEEGSPVDGVYCIHSGRAALTRRDSNQQSHCTYMLGAGDLVGIPAILTDGVHSSSAVTIETVVACFVSKERFQQTMRDNPTVGLNALRQISLRIDHLQTLLDDSDQVQPPTEP